MSIKGAIFQVFVNTGGGGNERRMKGKVSDGRMRHLNIIPMKWGGGVIYPGIWK